MRLLGGPARAAVAAAAALALLVPLAPAAHAATDLSASGSGLEQTASSNRSRTYSMPVTTTSVTVSGTWDYNPCGGGSLNEIEWFTTGDVTVNGSDQDSIQVDTADDCSASETFTIADASVGDSFEFDYYSNNDGGFLITINIIESEPEPAPEPEPEPIIEQPPNTPSMDWTFQTTDSLGGPVTVTTSWKAPSITRERPVTQYQATIRGDRGAERTCTTAARTCTVGNLPRNQLYSVSVQAINGAGWSNRSGSIEAVVAPEPPSLSNIRSVPFDTTVRVFADITPPANDGGWFLDGYDCKVTNLDNGRSLERRAENVNGQWECNVWDLGTAEFLGSPIKVEARSRLNFTAVSKSFRILTSGWASEEAHVLGPPSTPVIKTVRASANADTAGIAVIWEASEADTRGGDAISGYTVTARGTTNRFPTVTCETDGFPGCGLTGLDPNGDYNLTVTARSALGQERMSDAVNVNFPALQPAAVQDVVWKDSLQRPVVWWSLPEGNDIAPVMGQHVEIRQGSRWVRVEPGERGFRQLGEGRYRFDDRGTSWRVRVRVTSTVGAGPWTILEPTKMTSEPTVQAQSRTGAMGLTFGACEDDQRIVYRYREVSSPEWVEASTTCGNTVTVPNLEPGDYEVQAAAEGVLGRSQYAKDETAVWAPLAEPTDVDLQFRHSDSTFLAEWSPGATDFATPPKHLDAELWVCGRAFTRIKGRSAWPADRSTRVRFKAPNCVKDGDDVTFVVRAARGPETSSWSSAEIAVPYWQPTRRPTTLLDTERFAEHEINVQVGKAYCNGQGRDCQGLLYSPQRLEVIGPGEPQLIRPPSLPATVKKADLHYEIELKSQRYGQFARIEVATNDALTVNPDASGFRGFDIKPTLERQFDSTIELDIQEVDFGPYRARSRLVYTPEPGQIVTSPWSDWSNEQFVSLDDQPITSDMVTHINGFGVDVFQFVIPEDTIFGMSRLDLLVSSNSSTDPFSKTVTLDADTPPFIGGLTRLPNGDYLAIYNYYTGPRNFRGFRISVTPYVGDSRIFNRDQFTLYVDSN